jgi:hypothetical protein
MLKKSSAARKNNLQRHVTGVLEQRRRNTAVTVEESVIDFLPDPLTVKGCSLS